MDRHTPARLRRAFLVCAGTLALTLALAPAAAPAADTEDRAAERERAAPEPVPPVVHRGIRYEVIHWGKARGLGQNGGYVAAIDANSGKELWLVQVYAIDYGADREADRLDVFITALSLAEDGKHLLVADENGRHFSIDLASHAVSPVAALSPR